MTRPAACLLILAALALAACSPLPAQDPALKDTLVQAKAAWAIQGDREGASAKFSQVLAALEPNSLTLDGPWKQVLCESYNWMAILDDRLPANRARAPKRLEALLDLNPDFEIDRALTNARLQGIFDGLRAAKLVKVTLSLDPPGGALTLDGKPRSSTDSLRYLLPGPHSLGYAKPGYKGLEQHVELLLKEPRLLDFKLVRCSSAITVFSAPVGAEVYLDGKLLGQTQGQAPARCQAYADKAGLRLEELSDGFLLTDLAAGKHLLELKAPCSRSRRLEIGENLTTPFADHDLEPIKLEPSRGTLSILCGAPGGELLLSGKSLGPVPVKDLPVCAEGYDLQVRFPAGSFCQHIDIQEGKNLTLAVRPKPRLTYAGFEGEQPFAGRDRFLKMLATFGSRLSQVNFVRAGKGESPQDCLSRLQSSHETELILRARPVPGQSVLQIELLLSTLTGEEERLLVRPLEKDPLGSLAARLETQPTLSEPSVGLTLLDLAGASGPWVLQADAAALKAGIVPCKPILLLNGKPVASVAAFRKALRDNSADKVTLSQGEAPVTLVVSQQPLELPSNAADLCYPFLLADFRLRSLGASGDEAGLLRLHQALTLMHFREYDKALEILRDAHTASVQGVSQGTLDFYNGVFLRNMGSSYLSDAVQAFTLSLKCPQATLFAMDGPLLAPLAQQSLADLKP